MRFDCISVSKNLVWELAGGGWYIQWSLIIKNMFHKNFWIIIVNKLSHFYIHIKLIYYC